MGLFDKIKHAIFGDKGPLGGQFGGHKDASPAPAPAPAPTAGTSAPASAPTPAPVTAPAATTPAAPVDVVAILTARADARGGGGNWRSSIVDLLKLLDLDSSLAARKELGDELNIQAGPDGSAEQNIALHKAVMRKLAENGGIVPAELRD